MHWRFEGMEKSQCRCMATIVQACYNRSTFCDEVYIINVKYHYFKRKILTKSFYSSDVSLTVDLPIYKSFTDISYCKMLNLCSLRCRCALIEYSSLYIHTCIVHTGERRERHNSDTEIPWIPTQPSWFFYVPGVQLRYTGPTFYVPHPTDEARIFVSLLKDVTALRHK